MTRTRMCVLVAVVQVALAIFLWWYAPLQISRAVEAVQAQNPNHQIQLEMDFIRRIDPAPAERVSLAINFPAAVVADLLTLPFPIQLYQSGHRFLSLRDLVFFGSTGVFWYWVTSIVIRRKTRGDLRNLKRPHRIGLLVCGVLFALFEGILALEWLFSKSSTPPYREVGPFGLLWSVALAAYFVWKMWSEFTSAERN